MGFFCVPITKQVIEQSANHLETTFARMGSRVDVLCNSKIETNFFLKKLHYSLWIYVIMKIVLIISQSNL